MKGTEMNESGARKLETEETSRSWEDALSREITRNTKNNIYTVVQSSNEAALNNNPTICSNLSNVLQAICDFAETLKDPDEKKTLLELTAHATCTAQAGASR